MKSSLCLIGKNEAQGLKDLYGDVGKYFDEVVLISTDHNKELIETAKELKIKVYDESFGKTGEEFDFSGARNMSFEKASGDVIAWFDLDDRIPNGYVLPFIFKAIEDKDADWIYCTYNYAVNVDGDVLVRHTKPRFFRKGTVKWQKTVHEDAVPTKSVKQVKDSDFLIEPLIVNHQNVFDEEKVKARSKRNLEMLLKEYKEDGDKTDLRTIQNIGMTYSGMQEYEKAIKFLLMHYGNTGAVEDKFWSLMKVSFCLRMLDKYDEAINTSLEALKLIPQWATAYFDIAETYSLMKKYDQVIEWTNIGLSKKFPDTVNIIQPMDYDILPLGRLADAYLMMGKYSKAMSIATKLEEQFPKNKSVKELISITGKILNLEKFVSSFTFVADSIRKEDRLKAIKLFDTLPDRLDADIRIQQMRFQIVPPKNWENKSIVIYCGQGLPDTHWAYPSIFEGVGGSEEAVINMSIQLTKLGYKVTVFNNCGELRGNYDGVEYLPFYHFNPMDNYNILIGWRCPQIFETDVKAKRKLMWLHDIAFDWQFSDKSIKNTDKFIFLSEWHRQNMPTIPDDKIFISNNGIDPEMFEDKKEKKPNSLLWTSSYDRGLLPFMKNIWPLIRKEIPDVLLTVAYGWNNIDKELEVLPELKLLREELTPILDNAPGINHLGRVSHQEVADLYKTHQVLAYASEFGETNNISSQKAQAAGCYVLTTQQAGATPEYLKFGEAIPYDNIYTDKKAQEVYAQKVIEYLKNPKDAPEGIVEGFSWKSTADSWLKGLL